MISLQSKTLKSLLQHHNSKASILWSSAFFMVQTSHLYMTSGKTIALTIWTFVSKVISLLSNMLSSFVIAFVPRSKHLLLLWLQSPSTVIVEPKKIKSVTVSAFSPSMCHEVIMASCPKLFHVTFPESETRYYQQTFCGKRFLKDRRVNEEREERDQVGES